MTSDQLKDIKETYAPFEDYSISKINSPLPGRQRLQMFGPSIQVVADLPVTWFDQYANAPHAINLLVTEVESLGRQLESSKKEHEYHLKVHEDAEKKLLRKLADAQSKQSDTAGKTDKDTGDKVHAKRKSSKRPGSRNKQSVEKLKG